MASRVETGLIPAQYYERACILMEYGPFSAVHRMRNVSGLWVSEKMEKSNERYKYDVNKGSRTDEIL